MLDFNQEYKNIKIEPTHVIGVGTKSEMKKFIAQSPGDTYYNFDKLEHVTFEIGEDDFKYEDKKECRVIINNTLYSKPYIDQIIEYTEGKNIITKEKKNIERRPYKRVIGNKYNFQYLLCESRDFPLVMTRANKKDDVWFILAPIIDVE